jgi:hypothetical protein
MIEMMYVYFDKNGDIKAISGTLNDRFAEFEVATFPLEEIKIFLADKNAANPGDYSVSKIKRLDGVKYSLVKKNKEIVYTRTLDGYLCKVPPITNKTMVSITNNTVDRIIRVSFRQDMIDGYNDGTGENISEIYDFLDLGPLDIYVTEKNNPYSLLYHFKYIPGELFDKGVLYFKYKMDLTNTSVYAKKLNNSYGYKEKS